MNELDNCKLLKGTFLVEISDEVSKSKSGLVLSTNQNNYKGVIVKCHHLDSDGKTHDEYFVGDKVLLNANYDSMTTIELDGKKYQLGARQNILLILDRA